MKHEYEFLISSDVDYDELVCEIYIDNEPCVLIFRDEDKEKVHFLDGIKEKNFEIEELCEKIRLALDTLMRHVE